jgi:hypothetical protein
MHFGLDFGNPWVANSVPVISPVISLLFSADSPILRAFSQILHLARPLTGIYRDLKFGVHWWGAPLG